MLIDTLREDCLEALRMSHRILIELSADGAKEIQNINTPDISTMADMRISESIINFFRRKQVSATVYSEEQGKIELSDESRFVIAIDDLDGTDNYFRGRELLNYCTVITVFDSTSPKFKDVLIAGILEHRSQNLWLAIRNRGAFLNQKPIHCSPRTSLNRRTLIVIDHYASSDTIALFSDLYGNCWVKDFGSAAFHLAGVSSGLFDGYVNAKQKAHELGAGYLLIKEAGGCLTDFEGNGLDDLRYLFDEEYNIVSAANMNLNREIREKIGV